MSTNVTINTDGEFIISAVEDGKIKVGIKVESRQSLVDMVYAAIKAGHAAATKNKDATMIESLEKIMTSFSQDWEIMTFDEKIAEVADGTSLDLSKPEPARFVFPGDNTRN